MHYANETGTVSTFEVSDLKINGNGHTVDSANLNYNFMFELDMDCGKNRANIEINDLTFKNFKGQAIFFSSSKVVLNNVKFINCKSNEKKIKCKGVKCLYFLMDIIGFLISAL